MTLEEAERWLDGLINRERQPRVSYARFGLEAIEALLARVGNPERDLSVIHLAGSKGKGSTALLIEALLLELGESVGTFTSPHLERWTERFRLGGSEVAGESLADVVAGLRPHVDDMRRQDAALWPSFFDATTAAAFEIFRRAHVDRAVVEVGLGGRLDSTNTVHPAVTCVTSIELEHTDKLGDTHAAIAGEKAGILKPGAPCVMGKLPPDAAKVVEERAASLGVRLERLGEEFDVEVLGSPAPEAVRTPLRFRFADGFELDARLAARGEQQHGNAAVAVAAVRALDVHADTRIAEAAQRAFAKTVLPGRIEVVERDPWVIIDGAHTRESARSLAAWLEGVPARHRHLVLSVALDKALDPILDMLLPLCDELTLTRAEPIRALAPSELAERVAARGASAVRLRVIDDPEEAVRGARAGLGSGALLCVAGSIYLAGIARRVLVGS
jgi:dihydrofolate synthase/folylpolyglutamate synthase